MATSKDALIAKAVADELTTIPLLNDSTLETFTFSRNVPKLFKLEPPAFIFIDFVANVTATPSTGFSFTVSIFTLVGITVSEVGTATSTDQFTAFSKELTAGTYYIGLQSTSATSYATTLLASFRGYAKIFNMQCSMGDGCSMGVEMERPIIYHQCDKELFYEVVEGSMPPGIYLTGVGYVKGVAPNMDCLPENADLPPGQNWAFQHNDGSFHPWGRQWRFKVRVSILESPEIFKDEWFCVKIHNNWSIDRDNFMAQGPHRKFMEIGVEVPTVQIPSLCPPVNPEVPVWQPQEIVFPYQPKTIDSQSLSPAFNENWLAQPCGGCEPSSAITVDRFTIPEALRINLDVRFFKEWILDLYHRNALAAEYKKFVEDVMASLGWQALLASVPVEVSTNKVEVVLYTYRANDPNKMMAEWNRVERLKLPMTLDSPVGEHMSINITYE